MYVDDSEFLSIYSLVREWGFCIPDICYAILLIHYRNCVQTPSQRLDPSHCLGSLAPIITGLNTVLAVRHCLTCFFGGLINLDQAVSASLSATYFCPLLKLILYSVKAKFHYAILVADRFEAGRRPGS